MPHYGIDVPALGEYLGSSSIQLFFISEEVIMKSCALALLALVAAFVSFQAHAQVPRTLTYQGLLTDSLGNPLPDASYILTFRLYQDSTGGSALWQESRTLQTSNGVFSTNLGEVSPLSLPFNQQYWLGLRIEPDPDELLPRMKLTSSAYSLRTQRADTASYALSSPPQGFADSSRIAGTIPNNTVSTPKLQDAAVTSAKLADNAVSTSKILNSAVTLGKIDPTGASNGQVITYNGTNLSWQTPPGGGLSLPYSGSANAGGASQAALSISNTASSGANYGIFGSSASPAGTGIYGTGNYGVFGITSSIIGAGTYGVSSAAGGVGVRGVGQASDATGVSGTGGLYGVVGDASSSTGQGVRGYATALTGLSYGVYGASASTSGTGVFGVATSGSGFTRGVSGYATSPDGVGVLGSVTGDGLKYGVLGENNSSTFGAAGVRGYAYGFGQVIGVEGVAPNGSLAAGVVGRGNTGGYFETNNPSGGYAGYFNGRVNVVGDLQVSGNIIGPTAWTNLPLASGYDGDAQYRKIGDMVQLRGVIHKTTGDINTFETVGTLPAEFRPPNGRVAYFLTGSGQFHLWVDSNGILQAQRHCEVCQFGDLTRVWIDGLSFSTTP